MFHFPTFPPHALCVQARVTGDESSRVSPFGNPRITVRLPTPRGLSQPPTSFIGSWCQGIHRVPLKTWLQRFKDARVHCAVLKLRAETLPHTRRLPHPHADETVRPRRRPAKVPDKRPFPQDPTACQAAPPTTPEVPHRQAGGTDERRRSDGQLVNVPPLSTTPDALDRVVGLDASSNEPDARCSLERR